MEKVSRSKNISWALENNLEIVSRTDIYNEMLDSVYEEIEICGLKYAASDALKSVDPVAYRCGMADYFSEELLHDLELKELDDGTLVCLRQYAELVEE